MEARLEGKVVLITGAAQGVGQGIALEAARSGAAGLVLTDRDAAEGEATAEALRKSGTDAIFVTADLREVAAPSLIFDAATDHFDRIDALVNAAGLTDRASLVDAVPALWEDLFAVNARAPFFLMQRLVTHLKAVGAPGAVVNILSINVYGGTGDLAVYSAAKAALGIATKNAAHAHRFDRIRVNGVNLGWTETPGEHRMQGVILKQGDAWIAEAAAKMPFGRLLQPEDVARLVVFLLSDASIPMTGSLIDQEQWVIGPRDR